MSTGTLLKSLNAINMGVVTFETLDCQQLNIGFLQPYQNIALFECLGISNGVHLAYTNNNELMRQIANRIKEKKLGEWISKFKGSQVCVSGVTRQVTMFAGINEATHNENKTFDTKSKL